MIQYILDYLDARGVYVNSQEEENRLEEGIALYLYENGIRTDEEREYFANYVAAHLRLIDAADLKQYFLEYPFISQVKQIAIEHNWDGTIPEERIAELRGLMTRLVSAGLGDKYVPAIEIKEILGRNG